MMACKDARIKRMAELLTGIRQIKAAAWEPAFIAKASPDLWLLAGGNRTGVVIIELKAQV